MPRSRMPCRDKMKALRRVLPLSIFRIILHLLSLALRVRFALEKAVHRVRAFRPSETLLHGHSLMPRVRMPCRDKMKALRRVLPLSIFRIILHLLSLAHQARFALVNQKKAVRRVRFSGLRESSTAFA